MESPTVAANASQDPPFVPGTDAAGEELHCPLCDYNLRGTVEPRCPECGYQFEWDALRDPARRLHPYLFEHHPERNLGSFVRTFLEGLRPGRFWKSLHPAQPSRPRRLLFYWLVMAVPMVLAAGSWTAGQLRDYRISNAMQRSRFQASILPRMDSDNVRELLRPYGGSLDAFLADNFPNNPGKRFYYQAGWSTPGALNGLAFALLAWPWLTFVTLLLFRFSMRRARIRPVHVLRCVLYSFDAVLWAGVAASAVVAATVLQFRPAGVRGMRYLPGWIDMLVDPYLQDPAAKALLGAGAALLPFMAWRLTVAYRQYLRFDRPAATVLASQVIVLLVFLVLAVNGRLSG
jgi:hypothetical protein